MPIMAPPAGMGFTGNAQPNGPSPFGPNPVEESFFEPSPLLTSANPPSLFSPDTPQGPESSPASTESEQETSNLGSTGTPVSLQSDVTEEEERPLELVPENEPVQEQENSGDGGDGTPPAGAGDPPPVGGDDPAAQGDPGVNSGNPNGNADSGNGPSDPSGGPGGLGGDSAGTPFQAQPLNVDSSNYGGIVSSLSSAPPTSLVAGFGEVGGRVESAKEGEKNNAETFFPEIEQPTGLGTGGENGGEEPGQIETQVVEGEAREFVQASTGEQQVVETETPVNSNPTPTESMGRLRPEQVSSPESFSSAVNSIPSVDPSIEVSPGIPPSVELTGDADPSRNEFALVDAQANVQEELSTAHTATQQNFGENELVPGVEPEMLTVETEIALQGSFSAESVVLPELESETASALDAGLMAHYGADLQSHVQAQMDGEQSYLDEAQLEQETVLADIEAENERFREEQIAAREAGRQEIDGHREAWRNENAAVMEEFDGQSRARRAEVEGQIETEVAQTNAQINQEFRNAEAEARAQTAAASRDIDARKAEAQERQEDRSWWDRAMDAVANFFDGLREAVSAIFDALREAVAAIIDAAKQLAADLIDAARDLVKGLIEAFAEALKAFVRAALAAFPEIAERICGLIDGVVERVQAAIDALAEALKTAVNALLDGLGAVVNALLDAYEAVIMAILDGFQLLIQGILEIMQGIANLVQAARQSPDHFLGQVSEEMLGQDMTQPLANEYPADGGEVSHELAAVLDQMSNPQQMEGLLPDDPSNIEALLNRDSYTAEDFDVPVLQDAQLSPELLADLQARGDGEFEIGSFDDEFHGIDALRAEFEAPESSGGGGGQSGLSEVGGEASSPEPTSVPMDANRDRFTPDAQGKVGPFSVMERARYMGSQMIDGIRSWFSENWPAVIAGLVAIIGGGIIANILTGGAIMAALPLVMQLVGAFFAAEAIMRATSYFGGYLAKAFPGDIAGGAVSLARALAIGASELVFSLLFGARGAIRAARGAARTVARQGVRGAMRTGARNARRAATRGVRETVGAARQLGTVARNGARTAGRNMVRGGRFVMGGLRRGALAGARSLDELVQMLGRRFKFRGFKLKIRGRRWLLFGIINPEVLLANGEVETRARGAGNMGDNLGGGIVISNAQNANAVSRLLRENPDLGTRLHSLLTDSSRALDTDQVIRSMRGLNPDEMDEFLRILDVDGLDAARAMRGGVRSSRVVRSIEDLLESGAIQPEEAENLFEIISNRGQLRGAMNIGGDEVAHHLIPIDLLDNEFLRRGLMSQDELGEVFRFNGRENGMGVTAYSSKTGVNGASPNGVHASHPGYTDGVGSLLKSLARTSGNYPPNIVLEELANALERNIRENCPGGPGGRINDLFEIVDEAAILDEVMEGLRNRM